MAEEVLGTGNLPEVRLVLAKLLGVMGTLRVQRDEFEAALVELARACAELEGLWAGGHERAEIVGPLALSYLQLIRAAAGVSAEPDVIQAHARNALVWARRAHDTHGSRATLELLAKALHTFGSLIEPGPEQGAIAAELVAIDETPVAS